MSLAPEDSPLANCEVTRLGSEFVEENFRILIGHCGTEDGTPGSVVYLTDANLYFGFVLDMIRLQRLANFLPPILLVGVGYENDAASRRFRDLTPSRDEGIAGRGERQMGGAEAFLNFLDKGLKPWVESCYAVEADGATFVGHSLGGLFGTYVLLTRPESFARYAISSPSLWWDDSSIFRLESDWAATHRDLRAAVSFGIGALETNEGRAIQTARMSAEERAIALARDLDMVADLDRFVEVLGRRAYPSLRF
jgi:uncharacterized protein